MDPRTSLLLMSRVLLVRCLSTKPLPPLPAAAARRAKLGELAETLAILKAENRTEQRLLLRDVRKELHALERAAVPESAVPVRVATFFDFRPIAAPEDKARHLETLLPASVMGTVKIAREGINGGLSMRRIDEGDVLNAFDEALGFRIALNFSPNETHESPYCKLKVKATSKALNDGFLGDDLDFNDCGSAVPPDQWHTELRQQSDRMLLLDVRNMYETDMGTFQGATPLNTATFTEAWPKLDAILHQYDPNRTDVYMFCTGGVRCIKAGAYVKQRLGFPNVHRLQDGVVGYERWLHDLSSSSSSSPRSSSNTSSAPPPSDDPPLFRGTNFVFDRRTK